VSGKRKLVNLFPSPLSCSSGCADAHPTTLYSGRGGTPPSAFPFILSYPFLWHFVLAKPNRTFSWKKLNPLTIESKQDLRLISFLLSKPLLIGIQTLRNDHFFSHVTDHDLCPLLYQCFLVGPIEKFVILDSTRIVEWWSEKGVDA